MQVACGPKLIMAPLDPEKLAAYHLTDLERTAKRDILFEADLGIPISLLDTAAYAVPDQPPPLAPEDAALLDEVRGVPCVFRLPGSIVACPMAPQASCVPAGWHAALTSKRSTHIYPLNKPRTTPTCPAHWFGPNHTQGASSCSQHVSAQRHWLAGCLG